MLTLPTDSDERKEVPLDEGLFKYCPAALAGVARHSKKGNFKHNPGQPLHHSRGKSSDHGDCILRHKMDINDMLAADNIDVDKILEEADALCWRALMFSQELYEQLGRAPRAPNAWVDDPAQHLFKADVITGPPTPPQSYRHLYGSISPDTAPSMEDFSPVSWHKEGCPCPCCKRAKK